MRLVTLSLMLLFVSVSCSHQKNSPDQSSGYTHGTPKSTGMGTGSTQSSDVVGPGFTDGKDSPTPQKKKYE